MDLALIMKAVLALSAIGVLSVALLATASKKFVVEVDPKIESILDALPGANCGACGSPSCFAAAEAMAEGRAPATTCVAGGKSTAEAVAAIMGESCDFVPLISARACGGGTNARSAYAYEGVRSCATVAKLAGGSVACGFGCFGYGDCVRSCPFDAMKIDARGLPVIDAKKCTGCGICTKECPRGGTRLLGLVSDTAPIVVRCSSRDSVKDRRGYCSKCCIACRKCEKACPTAAIVVTDGLAVLDPATCISCYSCVDVCPQDCIDVHGRGAAKPSSETDGASRTFGGFVVDTAAVDAARPASEPEA
ncbi:MAG: RnfABCDGE type electron transport complex subunit B [Coriobacteriia bacterium]|nr:RnfABCDGE type electron transport complex subunit B [Coriobacteriia bacterium]